MSPEYVGYRYSRAELSALILLMNIDGLHGFIPDPLDAFSYESAIASLASSGLLARTGEQVLIDRITALILSAMHRSSRCLIFRQKGRCVAVFRSDIMYVLAEYPARGSCTLTPLQSASAVSEPLTHALSSQKGPFSIELMEGGTAVQTGDLQEATPAAIDQLLRPLCPDAENPSGREPNGNHHC